MDSGGQMEGHPVKCRCLRCLRENRTELLREGRRHLKAADASIHSARLYLGAARFSQLPGTELLFMLEQVYLAVKSELADIEGPNGL